MPGQRQQHLGPRGALALERPAGVGGAGRSQPVHRHAQRLGVLRVAKALPAVVGDGLQCGAALAQAGEVVEFGGADGGVQTAFALASGVHVPDAQTVRQRRRDALGVACRHQVLRPQRAQDFPELVLRVAIVLLGAQRGDAGETAEHQHAGVRIEHRGQALQAGHLALRAFRPMAPAR